MATPLNDALDQIATDWAALTPPDRANRPYFRLTGTQGDDDFSVDRGFDFEIGDAVTVAESGDGEVAQTQWTAGATLFISLAGYGRSAAQAALANELNLLRRAVERRSTWPAGVHEVWTAEGNIAAIDDESGLGAVALSLFVLTDETD